jgi:hypothetical protein
VENFKHIVLNNGVHDSVGGMASAGLQVSFTEIVKACGYTEAWRVERSMDVDEKVAKLRAVMGSAMLEVMAGKGARSDLGRPKSSPIENKTAFQEFLSRELFPGRNVPDALCEANIKSLDGSRDAQSGGLHLAKPRRCGHVTQSMAKQRALTETKQLLIPS